MMNLDGYCELMKVMKNSSDYKNFYKLLFYPLKIDSYMEKHKIYEILGELLFRIGLERPSKSEIIDFMIENLCKLNEHFNKKETVKIEFHNCTADSMKYLKKLSSQLQIPIIYENSQTPENHPKIICDFKVNSNSDKFMIISTQNDTNNNNSNQEKSHDCNLKLKKAIELKLCYNNLKYVIQNARLKKPLKHTHGEWNHRVLMVGRVGSGRKTQASQLAKEFGLILIDFDHVIKEYEQQSRTVENSHSMDFWGFMQETLLNPQCLHNGYVIVSNVISRMYLIMFMEKFIHEPNKIIFIHTNENKCRRRILKQKGIYHDNNTDVDISSTSTSQTTLSSLSACGENVNLYLDYQMNLYNLHKKDFLRYFAIAKDLQQKIYHVNGNGSVNEIKSWIWAHFCDK